MLFARQEELGEVTLERDVESLMPNAHAFSECLDSDGPISVESEAAEAAKLRIDSTPTFFLGRRNGSLAAVIDIIQGSIPESEFERKIDKLLASVSLGSKATDGKMTTDAQNVARVFNLRSWPGNARDTYEDSDAFYCLASNCQSALNELWAVGLGSVGSLWAAFEATPQPNQEHCVAIVVSVALTSARAVFATPAGGCRGVWAPPELRTVLLLDWIRTHCDKALQLADASRAVGYSSWHASHMLRLRTGFTFGEHLRMFRTLLAVGTLTHQLCLSIKEVASLSGFSSTGELDRAFERVFHMTPTTCRLAGNRATVTPYASLRFKERTTVGADRFLCTVPSA
jgi:AraC-like DNA-binding protein